MTIRDRLMGAARFFAPEGAAGGGTGTGTGTTTATGTGGTGAGTGTGTGTTTGPGSNSAFDWKGAGVGDDVLPIVSNNGFQNPAAALKAYDHLQRTIGMDKLALPPEKDGKRDWSQMDWSKLGRPAEAIGEKGYKIVAPQGYEFSEHDKAFQGHMLPTAHKLGLAQWQVDGLMGAQHEFNTKANEAAENKFRSIAAQQTQAVFQKWGEARVAKMNLVNRLHQALGLDGDAGLPVMKALRDTGMTGKWLEIAAQLGEMMAGDNTNLAGDGSGTDFGAMTPDRANAEIQRLKADKAFNDKFLDDKHPENEAAKALMTRLQLAANPKLAEQAAGR